MLTIHSVIVVGAGISGLACAYALKKSGHNVLVLESSSAPGGMIRSVSENGFLFETGPQSFSKTPAIAALVDELGISDDLLAAPPRAPRYILVDGKLKPVPLSPPAFLTSSLFSWSTKFSLFSEPFRTTHPPSKDESVADFVLRKFTPELLDLFVAPFVTGIYAGNPWKLSLRAAFPQIYEAENSSGSVLRGMRRAAKAKDGPRQRPTVSSFRKGNESLIRALANSIGPSLICNARVSQIARSASGEFSVAAETASGSQNFICRNIVIATPAKAAGHLLRPNSLGAAFLLSTIKYAPVTVISFGYRRTDVANPLQGFGFLVRKTPASRILGTVWNSFLFPERSPSDHVLLTNFLGGTLDPAGAGYFHANPFEAHLQLKDLLGIASDPVICRNTAYVEAIPQYHVSYLDRLSGIQSEIAKIPNLYLTGNYLKGPSLGACIEHAQSVAESIRMR